MALIVDVAAVAVAHATAATSSATSSAAAVSSAASSRSSPATSAVTSAAFVGRTCRHTCQRRIRGVCSRHRGIGCRADLRALQAVLALTPQIALALRIVLPLEQFSESINCRRRPRGGVAVIVARQVDRAARRREVDLVVRKNADDIARSLARHVRKYAMCGNTERVERFALQLPLFLRSGCAAPYFCRVFRIS